MKESTKNRLKKVGKVSAYACGLVFMLLMGLVVGKCSADTEHNRSSSGSSSPDTSSLVGDYPDLGSCSSLNRGQSPFVSNPKYADDVDTRPNLLSEYGVYCDGIVFTLGNPPTIAPATTLGTYVLSVDYLQVGSSYYFICPEGETFTYGYCSMGAGQSIMHNDTGVLNEGDVIGSRFNFGDVSMFTPSEGSLTTYWYLWVRGSSGATPRLVLASSVDYFRYYASHTSISLPKDWVPLNLWGMSYSNEFFGSLYGITDERVSYQGVMNVSGFVGDNEGFYFDSLRFTFFQMNGTHYLNSSGQVINATGSIYLKLYFCQYVEALNSSTNSHLTLWSSNYGTDSNGNAYLSRSGYWLDERFRNLVILTDSGEGGVGVSTAYPDYNYIQWLSVVNNGGGSVLSAGGTDVFSLISTGFSSVAGVLNIQILPFLTLGTLLLAPLVVLIALAILKVLNK